MRRIEKSQLRTNIGFNIPNNNFSKKKPQKRNGLGRERESTKDNKIGELMMKRFWQKSHGCQTGMNLCTYF